jgi:hypothetical protein
MVETRDMAGGKAYRLVRVSNNQIGSYTYNGSGTASMTAGSLNLSYANANTGTATTNVATIVNNFYEHFEHGQVKFIMKAGTYGVTASTGTPVITQSVNSDDGQYTIVYVKYDIPSRTTSTVTIAPNEDAEVQACHVFYNGSNFDGNNVAANALDDGAIATNKSPLRPGQTATLANYTSFLGGLNGIMVDITSPAGTVTLSDFTFRTGNDNSPAGWAAAPAPSMTLRAGAGTSGSNRYTFIWPTGTIQGKWLQITVKATAATGIDQNEVFYYGNAVGESGNEPGSARVDTTDEVVARQDPHKTFGNPATLEVHCDFNRDARADTYDELIARNFCTNFLNELRLISVP